MPKACGAGAESPLEGGVGAPADPRYRVLKVESLGSTGVVPRAQSRPRQGAGLFLFSFAGFSGVAKEVFAMTQVTCVVCEGQVTLPEGAMEGEILLCGDCGTELELVRLDPPAVEEAPQVQEDWGE